MVERTIGVSPAYPLKTLILAGGKGEGLRPITEGKIPKCFVELDPPKGVRGIDYLHEVFTLLRLKPEDIIFSADYYFDQYENFVKKSGANYTMLYQRNGAGNAGALEQAIQEFGNNFQYLVVAPDTFFRQNDLDKLIKRHIPATVSWGVSTNKDYMEKYYGLVVDDNSGAVLGDVKMPYWKGRNLENMKLYVKGALQIFDPQIFIHTMNVYKRLFKKDYPIDLYWDISPLLEEQNYRMVSRNKRSVLQAVVFDGPIVDFGTPERLEHTRKLINIT